MCPPGARQVSRKPRRVRERWRFQVCLHLDGDAEPLLPDCRATALIALKRAPIDQASIGWIGLSHLHGDHFGDVARSTRSTSTSATNTTTCHRVVGLIALCPDHHAVKHLARTQLVDREQGDPTVYENALRHLARVNEWDAQRVRDYLAEVGAEFRRREALGAWTQDFSPLLGTDA